MTTYIDAKIWQWLGEVHREGRVEAREYGCALHYDEVVCWTLGFYHDVLNRLNANEA